MNKHAENNGKNCQKLTKFERSCTVAYLRGGTWCDSPWQAVTECKFCSKVHKVHQNVAFPGIKFQSVLPRFHLKNYLRSTMYENWLNGLSHLYINKDDELDYRSVTVEFLRFNRHLSFMQGGGTDKNADHNSTPYVFCLLTLTVTDLKFVQKCIKMP